MYHMDRKLIISLPYDVYEGLRRQVDDAHMSQFIEQVLRPIVVSDDDALLLAYREMASDSSREQEAMEWIEASPDDALE
jgi:hypothetical protein